MFYIIFDKEEKLYGDIIGYNKDLVWEHFIDYAEKKGIDEDKYEVVEIAKEEVKVISEWFEKEYLMATVDKFIVDKKIKEKN